MAITREQIIAGLKKVGPCSPGTLADHLQVEASALGYHLKKLLAAGDIKTAGATSGRRIALPEQKLDAAPPQQRQQQEKKPRKRGGKAAPKPRRAKRAKKNGAAFLPALTAEGGIAIFGAGGKPIHFTAEQTGAIVDLVFAYFEE